MCSVVNSSRKREKKLLEEEGKRKWERDRASDKTSQHHIDFYLLETAESTGMGYKMDAELAVIRGHFTGEIYQSSVELL